MKVKSAEIGSSMASTQKRKLLVRHTEGSDHLRQVNNIFKILIMSLGSVSRKKIGEAHHKIMSLKSSNCKKPGTKSTSRHTQSRTSRNVAASSYYWEREAKVRGSVPVRTPWVLTMTMAQLLLRLGCRWPALLWVLEMYSLRPWRGLSGRTVILPILQGEMICQRTNSQKGFVRMLRTGRDTENCVGPQFGARVHRWPSKLLLCSLRPPSTPRQPSLLAKSIFQGRSGVFPWGVELRLLSRWSDSRQGWSPQAPLQFIPRCAEHNCVIAKTSSALLGEPQRKCESKARSARNFRSTHSMTWQFVVWLCSGLWRDQAIDSQALSKKK